MNGVSKYSGFTPAGSSSWAAGQVPNWKGGAFDGWRHAKSVYAVDFMNGRAMSGASEALVDTCVTITRASPHYLEGDDGAYQKFDADRLALMAGDGAFIGGPFTNQIRNPRGERGVVGTVGVTNKCTGYNAAPPALIAMGTAVAFNAAVVGMVAGGGDTSTLFGVVDDTTALEALAVSDPFIQAGLDKGWLNGRVFKIDNSVSAVSALVTISGQSDNTNAHSFAAYCRVDSGVIRLKTNFNEGLKVSVASYYSRLKSENVAITHTNTSLQISVDPGSVAYFILFDLIQAVACPPVLTVIAGASATGAMPTNWTRDTDLSGTRSLFLGCGTEDGLAYGDIRLFGIESGAQALLMRFDSQTYTAALAGQAWGADFYVRLIAGSLAGISGVRAGIYDQSNALISLSPSIAPTGTRARCATSGVVSAAASTFVCSRLEVASLNNGAAVDATLRIYAPKLVQLVVVESAEKVVNGDFDDTSGLIVGENWSAAAGVATHTPGSTASLDFSDVNIAAHSDDQGAIAKFSLVVSGSSAGIVRPRWTSTSSSGNGAFTNYGVFGDTAANFGVIPSADFDGSIDNVSIKLLTAGYMPTFPILPPVGIQENSVRYADVVGAVANDTQPFSGWKAAGLDEGVSIIVDLDLSHVGDGTVRPLFEISDGSADNYIRAFIDEDDRARFEIIAGSVQQASVALTAPVAIGRLSIVCGWAADGGYICDDVGQVAGFSVVALPAGLTQIQVSGSLVPAYLNDMLRQLQVCSPLTQSEAAFWAEAV